MNRADKNLLGAVWSHNMGCDWPMLEASRFLGTGAMHARLNGLARDGMLSGSMRLTKRGRAELTVVMCGGVFDILHHGHVHTLNAAKSLGDVLCVVVASDATVRGAREKTVLHGADTRRRVAGSVGVVDACIVGHDTDMFESVCLVRPDIIALGYDQAHRVMHVEAGCRRLGLDVSVVRLDSPVPGVSSSDLKVDASLDMT